MISQLILAIIKFFFRLNLVIYVVIRPFSRFSLLRGQSLVKRLFSQTLLRLREYEKVRYATAASVAKCKIRHSIYGFNYHTHNERMIRIIYIVVTKSLLLVRLRRCMV